MNPLKPIVLKELNRRDKTFLLIVIFLIVLRICLIIRNDVDASSDYDDKSVYTIEDSIKELERKYKLSEAELDLHYAKERARDRGRKL